MRQSDEVKYETVKSDDLSEVKEEVNQLWEEEGYELIGPIQVSQIKRNGIKETEYVATLKTQKKSFGSAR